MDLRRGQAQQHRPLDLRRAGSRAASLGMAFEHVLQLALGRARGLIGKAPLLVQSLEFAERCTVLR